MRSETAFAHLCGVAPIPASSGKTHRHRPNRSGDRAANNAFYTIVLTRLRLDNRTHRYLARELYQAVVSLPVLIVLAASQTAAGGSTLKRRRRAQRD